MESFSGPLSLRQVDSLTSFTRLPSLSHSAAVDSLAYSCIGILVENRPVTMIGDILNILVSKYRVFSKKFFFKK